MATKLKPFITIGPGQIIKRNLKALNWTQNDLAEIISMRPETISQLIQNKQGITPDTAIRLGKAFNSSPEFWLNLAQAYQLRMKEETEINRGIAVKAEIRKYMPLQEMKKKGWITFEGDVPSQVKAYCQFWNLPHHPDNIQIDVSMYEGSQLSFCARQKNDDGHFTRYYTLAWLQKVRQSAALLPSIRYSRPKLEKLYQRIPEYTRDPLGVKSFLADLCRTGVKFLVVSHLSKTYLDGACFMDGPNPVIAYTARYDRLDNFWFTIAHEMAHVLLHLKDGNDCFIDNLENPADEDQRESEANEKACGVLGVEQLIANAKDYQHYFSEERLLETADKSGLDPSIALGFLQHFKIVDYRCLNRYRRTVMNLIPDHYIAG
ncbi:MAG: HigA family addiction module antidote protein [Candidatus Delongbacteria bacterium]|nr:HigA family addiction module antidote protein [Candidatus Delongbacteria bacterium]